MRIRFILLLICCSPALSFSQGHFPHTQAHSHNDYEHVHPLRDALLNGFISVEADVHLKEGKLFVAHNHPHRGARTLENLYLAPLDSLLKANKGHVYPGYEGTFYLMIDCKTEAETTYQAIRKTMITYPALMCSAVNCPVKIFLSGNRPIRTLVTDGYSGIAIDGRPDDLGKGYSVQLMPVISDHFRNWSKWNGQSNPSEEDLRRIKDLAQRVHAEGKKLRLWATPDNEKTWNALSGAGVDFINTDRLQELNHFLTRKGL